MMKHFQKAVLIILVFIFLITSSSCGKPQSTLVPVVSFVPSAAIGSEGFSIAMFYSPSREEINDALRRCVDLIEQQVRTNGGNVRIKLKPDAGGDQNAAECIRSDVAAGTVCDGYIVPAEAAPKLLTEGLTKDLSSIVPAEAPVFYSKYKKVFPEKIAGVPLGMMTHTVGFPAAFIVEKEIAVKEGIQVSTLSDVLQFLESSDPSIQILFGLHGGKGVFSVWAGEQGYYPLEEYGFGVFLYARYDDPACTPIPIEKIDGFQEFTGRYRLLADEKRFVDGSSSQEIGSTVVGYIGGFAPSMDGYFLSLRHKAGRDYVAFPLKGCSVPVYPEDEPFCIWNMVVSFGSDKAAEAVRFIQWVETDQDHYDLVTYGRPGVDYSLVDGRMQLLKDGAAVSPGPPSFPSGVFHIDNFNYFYNERWERATVNAASNFSIDAVAPAAPPIWDFVKPRTDSMEFAQINESMSKLMGDRSRLIYAIGGENADGKSLEQCYTDLAAMEESTQKLIDAYVLKLMEIREAHDNIKNN